MWPAALHGLCSKAEKKKTLAQWETLVVSRLELIGSLILTIWNESSTDDGEREPDGDGDGRETECIGVAREVPAGAVLEEASQSFTPAEQQDGIGRVGLECHGRYGELHLDPDTRIRHEDVFSDKAPERAVAENGRSRVAEGAHQHCLGIVEK